MKDGEREQMRRRGWAVKAKGSWMGRVNVRHYDRQGWTEKKMKLYETN